MAGEIEAKFWLEIPSENLIKSLHLDSLAAYNIAKIRASSKKITGSEPEFYDFLDHFYIKTDFSRGYSAQDLNAKVKLQGKAIKYNEKTLKISVERGKDINTEYQGFIRLLRTFLSGDDKTPIKDLSDKYAIRLRNDRATNNVYITLKCKHGKADEQSEEYEFLVDSKSNAEDFLSALGYEFRAEKTKVKKQERYSFEREGVEVHIEINKIEQLGGIRFLEVEAVPKSIKKSPGIDFIYKIAKEIGIKSPNLNTSQGGNREDRKYWQLQKDNSR